VSTVASRVARLDWAALGRELDERGHALTTPLLTATECRRLAVLWDQGDRFRSHVDMAQHRFGLGSYRYFADPLPEVVGELRREMYARLAPIANRWSELAGARDRFPAQLDAFTAACAAVRLHALAGRRAADRIGADGVIASDVIEALPRILAD